MSGQEWHKLVALEPALGDLERDVRDVADHLIRPNGEITVDQLWVHGGLKTRLAGLAGWGARRAELRCEAAYMAAYRHLYGLLEDRAGGTGGT